MGFVGNTMHDGTTPCPAVPEGVLRGRKQPPIVPEQAEDRSTMLRRRWWTAVALAALAPSLAGAQVVRGTVTDSTNRPISGVVVVLIDRASQSRARALSDERGEFRIAAP